MIKLDEKDFKTLQDGLDALVEKGKSEDKKENKKRLKRVKEAEDALITIGTY